LYNKLSPILLPKINIGNKCLHDCLTELFKTDAEAEFEWGEEWDEKAKLHQIELAVKYVIMDNEPEIETSFNDLSAAIINGFMSPDYIGGCYSEYTCGYGDFDFLINTHSIFKELESELGKYIHLQLKETA